MMGNTYVMLASAIPPARNGVYMGIFNMFIVIPMLIETLTMPLIYRPLLGGDPRHAVMLGGILMIVGSIVTLRAAARHSAPPQVADARTTLHRATCLSDKVIAAARR